MTRRFSQLTILAAVAAAVACASMPAGRPATPSPQPTVTFVHFNDMHEMVAGSAGRLGGIARIATIVERERRAREAVLVTLGGDFLSPSALSTARVGGEALDGRQVVSALNLLGLDWATFGNHEFDLNERAFLARMSEVRFGIVSTNVTDASGRPFAPSRPSAIATVRSAGRDVRIGLVGLTIDLTIKPYVRYLPAVESARAQVAALAGKVDAIVALSHLGLSGELAVVQAVPEIDLLLGGHEHENYLLRRGSSFATIAKADSNAKSVVIATMTVPGAGARPRVETRLERLDDRVPESPAMLAEVRRWTSAGFEAFRRDGFNPETVITVVPDALDGRDSTVRQRPGNLTELISSAIDRAAGDVDVAILNGGSIRVDDVLAAGPITEYDIIRVLPFGGQVLRAEFDGALLVAVLDAGVANQGSGGYLHPRGAARVNGEWQVGGRPIDPSRRYSVAVPEYLLTGGEARMSFLTRENPQVHGVEERGEIRQAVMAELRARYPVRRVPTQPSMEIQLRAPAR